MKLLWLDLETTGLDPDKDLVLEVAAVVTDSQLRQLARYESVVGWGKSTIDQCRREVSRVVQRMHTRNGLWEACTIGGHSLRNVAAQLTAFASDNHCLLFQSQQPTYLAGASVHFDRRFLRRFAPQLESRLHHRHFDVSGLRAAIQTWGPNLPFPHNDNHRAMGDVLDAIAQAEVVKGMLNDCRTV